MNANQKILSDWLKRPTSKIMIPVPLLNPKFATVSRREIVRTSGSKAALVPRRRARRQRQERHPGAAVADVFARAPGGESGARELLDHRRGVVAGEPDRGTQARIGRQHGAGEA